MSSPTYLHLFSGSSIEVLALSNALAEKNITPVVKDESESARLAGFGQTAPMLQRVFVHEDEYDNAKAILKDLSA
ncbi:MAG: DUF2007 domain-containing protein [Flavobacteriaceae bacterium]|jgi:hypothetical protein|nr:DUF2007 domain-containing protein [Flavobacteriaceae bacterium]